jgi:dipeptidyl-peptidase-4
MKKLLILFIAKTSLVTAQKTAITIEEIWNDSFKTEHINSMNGEFNAWKLKPSNFDANNPFDQKIYLEKTQGYIYSIK